MDKFTDIESIKAVENMVNRFGTWAIAPMNARYGQRAQEVYLSWLKDGSEVDNMAQLLKDYYIGE